MIDEPKEVQPFQCQMCENRIILAGLEPWDEWECDECEARYRYEVLEHTRLVMRLHP